jgi:WD40 repeat protein
MKKLLILLIQTLFIFTVSFSQNQEIAVVKHSLPEFRDASIWKGRAGLTLFSPDGKYLAISGKTADVVIYETATGTIKTKIDRKGFTAFSFNPDGKSVIVENLRNGSLGIYETETGKEIRTIEGRSKIGNMEKTRSGMLYVAEMSDISVSPNWKNILVIKNDQEYGLFDFASGSIKYELQHEEFNKAWEVTKLLFGGSDNNVYISPWLLLSGANSRGQFSSDSKSLVISNGNKNPTLWNVENGKLITKFELEEKVYSAIFSPDGKMIATSAIRGVTKVWDAETGKMLSNFGSKKDKAYFGLWSSDSLRILTVSFNKKNDVKSFDAKTGTNLFRFENSDTFRILPNNDKTIIATVPRKDKSIFFQIWEMNTGKLLATVPRKKGENSLVSLKWSPDNQLIATTNGLRNDVQLWNLSGEHLQTLPNTTFPMKFSDDGKLLATGGKTSDPKNDIGFIWDLKSKQ